MFKNAVKDIEYDSILRHQVSRANIAILWNAVTSINTFSEFQSTNLNFNVRSTQATLRKKCFPFKDFFSMTKST